ncbi:mannose-P-dolichol utilization defect 1 protein homolog [Nasonia vitripennis]|uniref:Solute carrier family 66 member 3 n=1 Tax=Nasonia vitripennis TaxID=7425 RepID=A0A7M7LRF8_NASVI|nr:mannose-P-dolichol utilization defect 1 protein homolog [Nasonia vitripennis]XP_008210843.1 mannose-P-dolichol utilization defect 1 protein homolog [Nasonia vitripennis]XP_008210844.1 mannose-P-dolichol utilization defect 1 protein homolog [Nasonia vitripennis]XP_016845582.1 mannose-P-dolichol utilization defect 1 protein homolog [Nasonia vitripennis]XP_031783743.1 mannose-P-dolichol utilization defect 1 protein homolog [Nasonia vitripennis]
MSLQVILQYISNGLSLITIGMCLVLKVPQISRLLDSKSAVGISCVGLMLELTSYSVMTCYNFTNGYSLLSYMEYPIILIQEYFLIYLVLKYLSAINTQTLLAVGFYFITCTGLLTQVIPKTVLTFLAPLCTPISASSKIAQLFAIVRAKNADAVSPKTWFISAFTNLTRVFTIWMDSADALLLGNFIISVALSSSIMFAALYYRSNPKKDEIKKAD